MKLKDTLIIFCLFIASITAVGFILFEEIPVVQFSNQTGKCVQVIPKGSCDNLPSKYSKEWVK